VGEAAKNMAAMNPENTIYDAKRIIGRKWEDPVVKECMSHWPFKVVNDQGRPKFQVTFKGETKTYFPEEISAMVLSKMKEYAETFLGGTVKTMVVTVPAYFSDAQREATKDAARISGFEVLRMINEPTSAILSYGLDGRKEHGDKEITCVNFDAGGGTLDISLIVIENGVFEVKATNGNNFLGGEDLDLRMRNYLANEFNKRYKKDMTKDPRSMRRLLTACERAKRTLSSQMQATVEVDSLFEGEDFYTTISRAKFEELVDDLLRKMLEPLDRLLKDGRVDKSKVDRVVLVGGSSRIPRLQQLLKEYFNGKELDNSGNPDLCVGQGACIQASILLGTGGKETSDLLLLDVTPLSLGVEAQGSQMAVIIPRNTSIPCSKQQTFSTASDNQMQVEIRVFEGERPLTKDNNLLGTFELSNIPPAPRGVPQIEITLSLDSNGILNCSAVEKSSGKENKITIKNEKGRLSKEEIDRMMKDAERNKAEDEKLKAKLDAKNNLDGYVRGLRTTLSDPKFKDSFSGEDRSTLESKLKDVESKLKEGDTSSSEDYEALQKNLEGVAMPIITKLYQQTNSGGGQTSGQTNSGQTNGGNGGSQPSKGPSVEEVD
jgi:L1 cell adhesion molecule like protein